MSNLIQVGTAGELVDGSMKEVTAQGRDFLLARIGDRYYAADNRCPHMGGKLSQGKLEGTVVTCPRHGSQFDLRDGKVVRWLKGGVSSMAGKLLKPPRPIATYPVKLDGDKIMLEM
jgi:3-phenylpropionate/trans-cinnamate dioxygenase ferredoxin subunit